ncbi:MAG: anthranilate phosphoribosyltransferase [Thermoplasmata archaeon]
MIAPTLARLLDPKPLKPAEARAVFEALLAPSTRDAERTAVLMALAARKVTASELAGFAFEMRRRALRFPLPSGDRPVDLCGSGGAPRPSFNVSTVSAFVVAGAGAPVVKHGNRSARGLCGSSDLLEALGLPVTTRQAFSRESYRRFHLAFLHAPLFHPATRAVAEARKLVGIPTLFNQLGPLSNPARVPYQVVGVPNEEAAERVAGALKILGVRRGLAVTSREGCDEFSPRETSTAVVWSPRHHRRWQLQPQEYLPSEDRRGSWNSLAPTDAAEEAERILAGGGGARRGSVLLTAGAALWVAGHATSFGAGVVQAREALDDGRAERMLGQLRDLAPHFPAPQEG